MHSKWTRKSRAWGCEVIRALEMDDALRVIRAFRYPSGMIFVDLNTQVEGDYGGYAWTEMMHLYFGDTALHIALKWKRHRAVKALLSLRPDWTIPNESGSTAEDLTLRVYGKDIVTLKGEQEREYENDAMWGEEGAMRRLEVAEQTARERARLKFLRELHATRTMGVKGEAKLLLGCGRVLAEDALEDDRRAATSLGITAGRWTAHICHELRRNRFAALRGATHKSMEAPLVPVASASSFPLLSPSTTQSIRGRSAGDFKRNEKSGAASGAVERKTDTGAGGHKSLEPQGRLQQKMAKRAATRAAQMTLAAASRSLGFLPPSATQAYSRPRAPVATTNTVIDGDLRGGGLGVGRLGTPEGVHLAGATMTSTAATAVLSGVTNSVVASFNGGSEADLQSEVDSVGEASHDDQGGENPGRRPGGVLKGKSLGGGDTSSGSPPIATLRRASPLAIVSKSTIDRIRRENSASVFKSRSDVTSVGVHSISHREPSLSGPLSQAQASLRGIQLGPLRSVLETLLTSTVIGDDGERIPAPTFPRVSAHHELKYCGPVCPRQTMVLKAVIAARPGVLTHLNLCGKRLGDEGAVILAPAIATIRSVDLRSNNISDNGANATAAALKTVVAESSACSPLLQYLSLAGNHVKDAGADALCEVLEEVQACDSSETFRDFLSWLSLARNPGVSDAARQRLRRALTPDIPPGAPRVVVV